MRKSILILILIILLIPQLCFGQMVIQNRDIKQPSETKLFISGNHQTPDFEDLSANKNQFTKVGDVKTVNEKSTTNPKYFPVGQDKGIYFDGAGDCVVTPVSDDFNFGSGNFTIDFYIYMKSWDSKNRSIFSVDGLINTTYGFNPIVIGITNTTINLSAALNNKTNWAYNKLITHNMQLNVWYHIAVIRNGTLVSLYINGSFTYSFDIGDFRLNDYSTGAGQGIPICGRHNGDSYLYTDCLLQNFRISKGIARWTSNFTPPALNSTYPTDSYTKLYIKGHDKVVNTTAMTDDSGTSKTITTYGDTKVGYSRGTAAYFDGNSSKASINDSPDFEIGSSDFTLDMWFYSSALVSAGKNSYIAGKWLMTGNQREYGFIFDENEKITFYYSTNGAAVSTMLSTSAVSINKWHHIAAVKSGTDIKLFVNGELQETDTGVSSIFGGTSVFQAGGWENITTDCMKGYLHSVRIFKGIARWTSNFTPPETEPVPDAFTKLLMRNSTLNIRDISASPKTINTAGNVTPRSIGSKQGIFFDGSGDYLALPLVSTSAMYLGTSDFTIEGWAYSLNTTISEVIINVGSHPLTTPDGYASSIIENKSSGTCRFRIYNNATTACADYTWPAAATSNKWNHIALVRSGTTFKCFINGVSQTVTTVTAFTGNINAEGTNRYWQFGRSGYDGSMQLYGYLTDVRVTGKALWTSNFTPPRRSGAF